MIGFTAINQQLVAPRPRRTRSPRAAAGSTATTT